MEHFICEIIKPIKRRSIKAALNKNKSMNKVLSVHTTAEQCLYQFLRDGKCYNGQDPFACEEFNQRAGSIDLKGITTELKARLCDSIVLKHREQAERKKVSAILGSPEKDDVQSRLIVIAAGGGRANKKAPKSLCTKCGQWVQYPHDPKRISDIQTSCLISRLTGGAHLICSSHSHHTVLLHTP